MGIRDALFWAAMATRRLPAVVLRSLAPRRKAYQYLMVRFKLLCDTVL